MLSFKEVDEIYNSPISGNMEWARAYNRRLLVHVEGVGMQEYLAQINNYENDKQFQARKDHAISNKSVSEELLRPVDNAFNARGGSKTYKFKSEKTKEEFIDKLMSVKHGVSLSEYVENVWFNKFVTDPNGLIFIEIISEEDEEEATAEPTAEPTYKNINSIRAYEQNGMFVDWVVFEPHCVSIDDDEKETKEFWVVDEEHYYLYIDNDGKLSESKRIDNTFDKVPAVLCSNIIDPITEWKRSPIDGQVELMDRYLISNSVLTITEFFHNYPQQWMYVPRCNKCNGAGSITTQGRDNEQIKQDCPSCNGSGQFTRKDVTDLIKLQVPEGDDIKIAPDISGYLTLPTESWELMDKSVTRYGEKIFFTQWGTTVSRDAKNETATGRYLDAQPINNRLEKYSRSIEKVHTALANLLGKYHFPETFDGAIIQYGRRYLIETPDQIWEKYLKAKKDNAPVSTLDLLLFQYLESEFKENGQLFLYETKKAKLEPFVHWDIVTVQKLNVAPLDYAKKLYFNDWIQTKDIKEIIETDIKILNQELSDFAEEKDIKQESINLKKEDEEQVI